MRRSIIKKTAALVLALSMLGSLSLIGLAAEEDGNAAGGEAQESVEGEAEGSEEQVLLVSAAEAPVTASDKLNVTPGTVVSNIFVYGESLSGMTAEEASGIANRSMDNLMNTTISVRSNDTGKEYTTTASALGISWNRDSADQQIRDAVLEGNVVERYKKAKDYQAAPVAVDLGVVCDETSIRSSLTDAIADWTSSPVNATISALTGELVVTPGSNGCTYDLSNGVSEFVAKVVSGTIDDSGYYSIDPAESITQPEFTTERLQGWSIIGKYTTEYAVPRTQVLVNREQNLKTGVANLTGRMFAPGETISALNLYGDVTAENGYAPAGTYINGGHQDELGGGLCQVTTTLYNAVILAELDIVYRHNHSYLVNYIPPGLDAMVYPQGGSDFKFMNTSSDYIKLEGSMDLVNQFITIWVIGHEDHAADHTVRYESELLSVTPATITRVEDPSLALGWGSTKFVKQSDPINGAQARCWKVTTDGGVETRTLFTNTDTYKPMNATISMAPDVDVVATVNGSQDAYFTSLSTSFLNGVSLGTNAASWTVEQREAFNAEMTALLAAKGLTWPDQGSSFSFNGSVLIQDETNVPAESEGEGEGEGESEGSSEADTSAADSEG